MAKGIKTKEGAGIYGYRTVQVERMLYILILDQEDRHSIHIVPAGVIGKTVETDIVFFFQKDGLKQVRLRSMGLLDFTKRSKGRVDHRMDHCGTSKKYYYSIFYLFDHDNQVLLYK